MARILSASPNPALAVKSVSTLDQLRAEPRRVLFECVSGSRAYGTHSDASDTDLRGVFAQAPSEFLALTPPAELIADARHNEVYYSLKRTLELLANANPNILELLYMPGDCVRIDSDTMAALRERREIFITRQCADTHIGYAYSQIKKAKGQNKWINQPKSEAPPRKEDYCYVIPRAGMETGSAPCRPLALDRWDVALEHCHAARLEHASGVYRLYRYGEGARGVFRDDQLALESIPIEDEGPRFAGLLLYNEQAWRQACEDHHNYWTWRRERNEARWQAQESGALDYDAKNLMHTVRLLLSGESILTSGAPIVRFDGEPLALLKRIRAGAYSYTEVMAIADDIRARCAELRNRAPLHEAADRGEVDRLLRDLTAQWQATCR